LTISISIAGVVVSSMSFHRVALIFDDRPRPDTTGVYVRRALAGLVKVVHFRPDQAELIPGAWFELYLSVDDDTEHRLPGHLRPQAYWASDTHGGFSSCGWRGRGPLTWSSPPSGMGRAAPRRRDRFGPLAAVCV
jgi:hypothetical protein